METLKPIQIRLELVSVCAESEWKNTVFHNNWWCSPPFKYVFYTEFVTCIHRARCFYCCWNLSAFQNKFQLLEKILMASQIPIENSHTAHSRHHQPKLAHCVLCVPPRPLKLKSLFMFFLKEISIYPNTPSNHPKINRQFRCRASVKTNDWIKYESETYGFRNFWVVLRRKCQWCVPIWQRYWNDCCTGLLGVKSFYD